MSGDVPVLYVREGDPADELLRLLAEEPTISVLVLGADPGPKGPGPLIAALSGLPLPWRSRAPKRIYRVRPGRGKPRR